MLLKDADAYMLYIPITDFLIRVELYRDDIIAQLEPMLSEGGVEDKIIQKIKELIEVVRE
jgi:hypothetical protein